MDNKIKYVDLNGLKMFAESLKQDLKNHVIELGLYQELLHRIENLELYKIVDLLPEKGDEDTIYLLKNPSGSGDKNVFIEYLYNNEHGWEEIGNFTPSFDLEDYLKIENASFEKGGSENSAVLKDGNNIAGLKGWYYKAIQFNTNTGNMYLYLTQTQQVPVIVTSVKDVNNPEKTIPFNLPNGTVLSIINDVKYDNQFRLTGNDISKYGRIIVKPLSGEFPFNDIKTDDDLNDNKFDSEDYSVYSTDNPLSGIADMGEFSVAIGLDNKATNNKAVAFGYNNHSYGKFSFTEGRDNKAAYCSHAEGNETQANGLTSHSEGAGTQANGDMSHAEGKGTITTGKCSHAEGRDTQAIGTNSHAEGQLTKAIGNNSHTSGYKTVANNNEESAFGRFNESIKDENKSQATQFSIGIGISEDDRKNAFEVKQNGDIYIEGVDGRIQDKLKGGNSVTPDWNARQGEAGYIDNKPCFSLKTIDGRLDNLNPYFNTDFENGTFYPKHDLYVEYENKTIFMCKKDTELYYGDGITIMDDNENCFYLDGDSETGEICCVGGGYDFELIFSLDKKYLPNTVIKTTPQSLSDTDKNQVLVNLGIKDKIDNLPSAESSVFEAVYGETTYEEIIEAYNAGKYVVCLYEELAYHLSSLKNNTAWFGAIDGDFSFRTWCNTSNVWYKVQYNLELASNKTKTISEASTDTQYPSAKAVYDAIQQSGSSVVKTTPQTLSNTEKNQVRNNIYAQEKLVSGVNIATINNKSILKGENINLGKTTYDIDLNSVGQIEGTTVTYTCKYDDLFGYYTDSDKSVEFKKLCKGEYDIVYSHGIGGTSDEVVHIIPTLKLVYSGTSIPNYYSNEIMSYYSCKDWLLTCHAVTENLSSLFNSETIITITLEKLI